MRRIGLLSLSAAVLAAATVPYTDLRSLERAIDQRIDGYTVADPMELLGFTRGVYLEGTGVVLTAEVDLIQTPAIYPFRPTISKEEIAKVHDRKKARLPELRKLMQDSMVTSATTLKTMPPQEQIIFGVNVFYHPWEDTTGLPKQILMQARKQALVDFERGTLKSLEGAVQIQEF